MARDNPEEVCPMGDGEIEKRPPTVTIAMPVYNGANFLAEAVTSILEQTYQDFELVIVDNASTDETAEICRAFCAIDDRIRYYCNERNLGAAGNYNRGLELARGTYFKWLAHDDWLSSNYIEKCVRILEDNPDVAVAFGMPHEMLDRETPFLDSRFTVPLWGDDGPVERFASAMYMPRTCHAIFGLMRRETVEKTTRHWPYYTSDRMLVAELALLGRIACAPEAIFYNRTHPKQSMAQAADRLALNTWQDSSNTRPYSTMNIARLRHVWEVSGRYGAIASRRELLAATKGYFFGPKRLALYVDEFMWMSFPRAYGGARTALRRVFRALRPSRRYMQKDDATLAQSKERSFKSPDATLIPDKVRQGQQEMPREETRVPMAQADHG